MKIYDYIASAILPNLRTLLHDVDRVNLACTGISASIIAPAFRHQKYVLPDIVAEFRVDATVLRVLLGLSKIPSATKAWRLQIGEAFNEARFFAIDFEEASLWKPLICALLDSDKERFGDLLGESFPIHSRKYLRRSFLGRITPAPSANIFTNREQEMISRSLNLRRLSFVLLAADRDHYLTQLPSIQEKLVEILRTNVVSPRVHSEVRLLATV